MNYPISSLILLIFIQMNFGGSNGDFGNEINNQLYGTTEGGLERGGYERGGFNGGNEFPGGEGFGRGQEEGEGERGRDLMEGLEVKEKENSEETRNFVED
uniref:Uncharacterized protein n=1 Tax=Meloidogyne enterolobii TaxID=390850 RepID=A0A6V7UIV8_MELEN|nr:unnamed protein product [Meloidogyne enterolobii]